MKQCPYCSKEMPGWSVRCPHCEEALDGTPNAYSKNRWRDDIPIATLHGCYGFAWHALWRNLGMLVLLSAFFIFFNLIGDPSLLSFVFDLKQHPVVLMLVVPMYHVFFLWPLYYGMAYACLRAVRGEGVRVSDLFASRGNYVSAIAATFLVSLIVLLGLALFIIPGVILGCRLAFVPYLVVESKMDCYRAIKTSMQMTREHTLMILLISLMAIPVCIGGIFMMIVGIVPAMLLVGLAFAALYHALRIGEE